VIPLRDANPTRRTPLVTLSLIVACFVVFAGELGLLASGGESSLDAFITRWGVVPADLTAAWARGDYLSRETATLVTSQFLHGSWLHLLGNMLYLWIFGNNVEDRFGRAGFLGFYLLGGALAGVTQVAIDPTSTVREGEAASVQNAGNIPDRIIGLYNSILKGQRLSPEQRSDFLAQSKAQFGKIVAQQKRVLQDAADFAKRHELDVQDIVPGYVIPPVDYSGATGQSPGDTSDPLRLHQIGAELSNLAQGVRSLVTGGKKVAEMSDQDLAKALGLQ